MPSPPFFLSIVLHRTLRVFPFFAADGGRLAFCAISPSFSRDWTTEPPSPPSALDLFSEAGLSRPFYPRDTFSGFPLLSSFLPSGTTLPLGIADCNAPLGSFSFQVCPFFFFPLTLPSYRGPPSHPPSPTPAPPTSLLTSLSSAPPPPLSSPASHLSSPPTYLLPPPETSLHSPHSPPVSSQSRTPFPLYTPPSPVLLNLPCSHLLTLASPPPPSCFILLPPLPCTRLSLRADLFPPPPCDLVSTFFFCSSVSSSLPNGPQDDSPLYCPLGLGRKGSSL